MNSTTMPPASRHPCRSVAGAMPWSTHPYKNRAESSAATSIDIDLGLSTAPQATGVINA